jgi:hypothetical protein
MRKLVVSLVVALAACGSSNSKPADAHMADSGPDAKVFLDAAPDAPAMADLSCLGMPFPMTAPPTVDVAGSTNTLNSMFQPTPVAGATVDACPAASLTCPANGMGKRLATATSDAMGAFTLSALPTSNVPLDLYIKATATGDLTSFVYPPHPLAASLPTAPVLMLDVNQQAFIAGVANVTITPGDATVLVLVVDCASHPISGATAIVQQNGMDVGQPFTSGQAMGGTLVFNVPADTAASGTTIGASYMGMNFPTHPVTAFADGIVETVVRPGP